MKRQRSIFKSVVAPIIVVVSLVPTIAIAAWEVIHGRGAATYSNAYGLAIHYTSILIFFLALFLTALAAYIARAVYFWREGRDGSVDIRKINATRSEVESNDAK